MTRNLIWLVLALSVLFNVFFAVGYVQARAQAAQAAGNGSVRRVADELGLDEGQRAVLAELRSALREESAFYGDAISLARQEIAQELARPEPDLARVGELVSRGAKLEQERSAAQARRFNEFLGVLSPPQCRALGRSLGRWPHRRGGPPPPEQRFDANHDGVLDEQERAAARQAIEAHRAERERRRAEFLERFDTNGDGRLDEAERAALREWRDAREGEGPRPGP